MDFDDFCSNPKYRWYRIFFYYPAAIIFLIVAYILYAALLEGIGYIFGFVVVFWIVTLPFKWTYKLIKLVRGR